MQRGGRGGRGGGGAGGYWHCATCNFDVFASKPQCFKCGTLRPEGGNAPASVAGMPPPAAWRPCTVIPGTDTRPSSESRASAGVKVGTVNLLYEQHYQRYGGAYAIDPAVRQQLTAEFLGRQMSPPSPTGIILLQEFNTQVWEQVRSLIPAAAGAERYALAYCDNAAQVDGTAVLYDASRFDLVAAEQAQLRIASNARQRKMATAVLLKPQRSELPAAWFVSAHLPFSNRDDEIAEALAPVLAKVPAAPLVIGGDFNADVAGIFERARAAGAARWSPYLTTLFEKHPSLIRGPEAPCCTVRLDREAPAEYDYLLAFGSMRHAPAVAPPELSPAGPDTFGALLPHKAPPATPPRWFSDHAWLAAGFEWA